jgi:tRNA modification GTPase
MDTAGLRVTFDGIENLGIERTHRAMSDADLVLVVLDASVPLTAEDLSILSLTENVRRLVVLNKADLHSTGAHHHGSCGNGGISISALTGSGLAELQAAILSVLELTQESCGLLVTNARHHELLRQAQTELRKAQELLAERVSEELVVVPLHNALKFIGEITGETTTEQILSQIFATFCIGK